MNEERTTDNVIQAWKRAEIHDDGPAVKRLAKGDPHGCAAGILSKHSKDNPHFQMSKKRKKSVPTAPPKQEKKLVIDMMKVERAKANHSVGFRTGRHLTEKDRPRKKDWKREYERGKGSGTGINKDWTGPFSFKKMGTSKTCA